MGALTEEAKLFPAPGDGSSNTKRFVWLTTTHLRSGDFFLTAVLRILLQCKCAHPVFRTEGNMKEPHLGGTHQTFSSI